MRVLLDTCVLSELRRKKANLSVVKAVDLFDENKLFVSVLSIGEIIKGITLLKAGKRKNDLSVWVVGLEQYYADRIVAIDIEVTRIWGEITANAAKKGKVIPAVDGLIAATAMRHGLHLMTCDEVHFKPTGAMIINPF